MLNKREQMAVRFMQTLLAHDPTVIATGTEPIRIMVKNAYALADAMLNTKAPSFDKAIKTIGELRNACLDPTRKMIYNKCIDILVEEKKSV